VITIFDDANRARDAARNILFRRRTAVGVSANIKFSSSILPRDIGMCRQKSCPTIDPGGEK
jgi:hypothetical protein